VQLGQQIPDERRHAPPAGFVALLHSKSGSGIVLTQAPIRMIGNGEG
jgi:hypothetical protein